MRTRSTLSIPYGRLAATLCLALLTAGCERLSSVTTPPRPQDPARFEVVKDTTGRTVRFDKITGEVTPVDKTKAPETVPPSTRAVAAKSTSRPSRRTGIELPLPASLTTMTPAPVGASQPVVVARPEPARIAFDEMCAEHEDIFAVTSMDAAMFAQPSIGTPLVTRVVGGTLVVMTGDSGEWLYVTVEGRRGPLSGFVHCSTLRSLPSAEASSFGSEPAEQTEPTEVF
jgi:hypothetical protein